MRTRAWKPPILNFRSPLKRYVSGLARIEFDENAAVVKKASIGLIETPLGFGEMQFGEIRCVSAAIENKVSNYHIMNSSLHFHQRVRSQSQRCGGRHGPAQRGISSAADIGPSYDDTAATDFEVIIVLNDVGIRATGIRLKDANGRRSIGSDTIAKCRWTQWCLSVCDRSAKEHRKRNYENKFHRSSAKKVTEVLKHGNDLRPRIDC